MTKSTSNIIFRLALAVGLISVALGGEAVNAQTNCFSYGDFSSTTGLVLVANAVGLSNVVRLTPAAQDQSGSMWYAQKQAAASGFTTTFQFRITNPGSLSGVPPGADGISFTIQNLSNNTSAIEFGAFPNSIAVSFNTFLDYGAGEPSDNFVGIVTNRDSGGGALYSYTSDLNPTPIRLRDGNVHTAQIRYDGSINVSIDGITVVSNVATPLGSAVDGLGKTWVGFGARTGWSWENHDILNWSFCSTPAGTPPVIANQPQTQVVPRSTNVQFTVGASGTAPLSYQWFKAGKVIGGATAPFYVITSVQSSNVGTYFVTVSNAFGSVISSNAVLAIQPTASSSNCLTYANFSSADGLALVGNSAIVGSALRLTPAEQDQLGNAWFLEKRSCSGGFDTRFQFQFTGVGSLPGTPPGADGFVFSVQNLGPTNTDFLSSLGSATNFMSVFFNTFLNWPGCSDYSQCDVSANSVGIVTNNMYVAQTDLTPLGINLKDGLVHEGRIVFDGTVINVWIDSLIVLTNVSLPGLTPGTDSSGQGWVGFSSHTGWAWENHDILNWSFCSGRGGYAPTITSQPQSQSVAVGTNVQFTVTANGTPPLTYQWFKGITAIGGATASIYAISSVQASNAGTYSVAVSNAFGSAVSSNAVLAIQPTTIPSSCLTYANFSSTDGLALVGNSAIVGSALRLTPAAQDQFGNAWSLEKRSCSGGFNTRFQFQFTGVGSLPGTPPGADGFVFSVQNLGPTNADFLSSLGSATNFTSVFFNTFLNWPGCSDYSQCDVSANSVGIVTNNMYVAQTDLTPLGINLKDGLVHEGRIVFDGNVINVWIDSVVVLTNVSLPGLAPGTDSSGQGWVGFSSHTGWAWENHDILNWSFCSGNAPTSSAPSIITQPQSQTVTAGANVTFNVSASGTAPLIYQWRFNGTNISGATGSSFNLPSAQTANGGLYSVLVTNTAGSALSSNALLTVNPGPSGLRVADVSVASGGTVTVPVLLAASGSENALSFSLNFTTSRLIYASTTLANGAGATVFVNESQTATGRLGIVIGLSAGSTFPPGSQELVEVTFNAAVVTNTTPTVINFGDQPIVRQVSDTQGHLLSAVYTVGTVLIGAVEYEGDVSPRTNGDKTVTVTDWVLIGRFAAGLDRPANGSEFQRADCAPRSALGNGHITITDWVQAGRYAAGLDPLTPVGGPSSAAAPAIVSAKSSSPKTSNPRQLRASDAMIIGALNGTVSVGLQSQGNENAAGFSLAFDPANLTYVSASLGSGANGTVLNVNTDLSSSGRLGFAVALGVGNSFPAGLNEVVKVTFKAAGAAPGNSSVGFADDPIFREVSDSGANSLAADYLDATVAINPLPSLRISQTGQNVSLAWPLWATDFVLQQAAGDLGSSLNWSNAPVTPGATTNESVVNLPIGGSGKFYRLYKP